MCDVYPFLPSTLLSPPPSTLPFLPSLCLYLFLSGESAVGKSSLVLRFVKGQFHEYQESTIGGWYILQFYVHTCTCSFYTTSVCMYIYILLIDMYSNTKCLSPSLCVSLTLPPPFSAAFLTQTVNLDDTTVKFEIWDTAGQERYHSLAPMYYRGAQAAIVVYDITNIVSQP